MRRFIGSALVASIIGIAIGVYLGWEQFPVEYRNSSMCQLSLDHQEDYTLMVARGFSVDQNRDAALARLLPLRASNNPDCGSLSASRQIDNIPAWVQELVDRYRTRGAELRDICDLAALSAAFGRQIPGYSGPGTVCEQFAP
jgi:hypothetical protein